MDKLKLKYCAISAYRVLLHSTTKLL